MPVGQAQIQHHSVVLSTGDERLSRARVARVVEDEAALLERANQPRRHIEFVFHQQNAHDQEVSKQRATGVGNAWDCGLLEDDSQAKVFHFIIFFPTVAGAFAAQADCSTPPSGACSVAITPALIPTMPYS